MTTSTDTQLTFKEWTAQGRPFVFYCKHPKLKSIGAYLKGIKKPYIRGLVRKEYKRRLSTHPIEGIAGMRELLADSVLTVMDHYESKNGGQNKYNKEVTSLRAALNLLHDDLGWNEEK